MTAAKRRTPCVKELNQVRAPAPTLAALRTTTDVTGRPPINPETRFPTPWAHNSRLEEEIRLYGSSRSAASSESSDSRLPTTAMIAAAFHTEEFPITEKSGKVNWRKKSLTLAGTGRLTKCSVCE